LVQEYCDCGTLNAIASEWIPEEECEEQMLERLLLLQDAAQGLKALHAKNVVHGDLVRIYRFCIMLGRCSKD
jgi:serine/threonine protein kinase